MISCQVKGLLQHFYPFSFHSCCLMASYFAGCIGALYCVCVYIQTCQPSAMMFTLFLFTSKCDNLLSFTGQEQSTGGRGGTRREVGAEKLFPLHPKLSPTPSSPTWFLPSYWLDSICTPFLDSQKQLLTASTHHIKKLFWDISVSFY